MSKYTLQFDSLNSLMRAIERYIYQSDDAKMVYMNSNNIQYTYVDNVSFTLDIENLTPEHLKEIKKLSPEQMMLADGAITLNT